MASQVFSGTGNFSYTNTTGENVRVVINFLRARGSASPITMSWGGVSVTSRDNSSLYTTMTIGRNLAFAGIYGSNGVISSNNATAADNSLSSNSSYLSLPTEIMLSNGQTFAISIAPDSAPSSILAYNIVVIPENG